MLEVIVWLALLFAISTAIAWVSYDPGASIVFTAVIFSLAYWFILTEMPLGMEEQYISPDQYETFVTQERVIFSINEGDHLLKSSEAWVYHNYQDTSKVKIKRFDYYNWYDEKVDEVFRLKTIKDNN